MHSWKTSYQSLLTLFRTPDPTYTVILIYLVNSLALSIQVILPQYTSLVLRWPLATVNAALALKALVASLVLFSLPTIRILYLEARMSTPQIDVFITQASLFVSLLGTVGLGVSSAAWLFITSLGISTSGAGLGDSLCAYGALCLPEGEQLG